MTSRTPKELGPVSEDEIAHYFYGCGTRRDPTRVHPKGHGPDEYEAPWADPEYDWSPNIRPRTLQDSVGHKRRERPNEPSSGVNIYLEEEIE